MIDFFLKSYLKLDLFAIYYLFIYCPGGSFKVKHSQWYGKCDEMNMTACCLHTFPNF